MIKQGSFSFDLQLQLRLLKTITSYTYGKTLSVNRNNKKHTKEGLYDRYWFNCLLTKQKALFISSFLYFLLHWLITFFWEFFSCLLTIISVLRKQLTFGDATTGFPTKWHLRDDHRSSILMTRHYPDLGHASDWLNQFPTRHDQSEALPRSG